MDIEVAREAFRLMLEKPPKEAGILELVSLRLHLLLVMPLRAILLNPSVNAALSGGGLSSPTDPTYEMLAVAKPSPASEADDMQQRMVNVFAVIYACPLVTDPLYFEVRVSRIWRTLSGGRNPGGPYRVFERIYSPKFYVSGYGVALFQWDE